MREVYEGLGRIELAEDGRHFVKVGREVALKDVRGRLCGYSRDVYEEKKSPTDGSR